MRCITVIAARGCPKWRARPTLHQSEARTDGSALAEEDVARRCWSRYLRRSLPGGRAGCPSGECQALVSSRAARPPCLDAESISAAASSRGNKDADGFRMERSVIEIERLVDGRGQKSIPYVAI